MKISKYTHLFIMFSYLYELFCVSFIIFIIPTSSEISTQDSNFIQFRECMEENGFTYDSIVDQTTNTTYYEQLNRQWNLRIPHVYPLGYFLPSSTLEVQLVVWCGSKSNISVIPKSGGHSYESFSSGNSNSLVIDFRQMNDIIINQNEQTATIQPGALVGSIYYKIWSLGFGLPMGQCYTVGIGGHALGGGYGYFSHLYGLALDNIIEMTMVDATGFVHEVSAIQNPDLFWALKGVGSGYIGIVTSFKFKLFKASTIKITFVKLRYNLEQSLDILETWQNWLIWTKENEPTVMSGIQMKGHATKEFNVGDRIEIHTVHIQDGSRQPYSNKKFLKMVYNMFPSTGNITVSYPSFMDLVIDTGYAAIVTNKSINDVDLTTLTSQIAQPRYHKVKSFHVNKWFDKNELQIIADLIQRMPRKYILVTWASERGVIQSVSSSSTAYVHRNSFYSITIQHEGPNITAEVEKAMRYMEEFMDGTKFMDSGETYQNYVDSDLKEEYLNRYYGQNLPKLLYTKRTWDPDNYFRNQQSIPVL